MIKYIKILNIFLYSMFWGVQSTPESQISNLLNVSNSILDLKKIDVYIFTNLNDIYFNDKSNLEIFDLRKGIDLKNRKLQFHPFQYGFKIFSDVYKKQKDIKNSKLYNNNYVEVNDSLTNAEKKNIQDLLKDMIIIEEKIEQLSNILFIVLLGIILILIVLVCFIIKYLKNYNREYNWSVSKDLVIVEKERQLANLEQKINFTFNEIVELAKSDDSTFLIRFKEVYPEFCRELTTICPVLTDGQMKFCALLRLNFSTKEIADYTHISVRSVEIKKNRLRKQLNISSSEDLNKWMLKL